MTADACNEGLVGEGNNGDRKACTARDENAFRRQACADNVEGRVACVSEKPESGLTVATLDHAAPIEDAKLAAAEDGSQKTFMLYRGKKDRRWLRDDGASTSRGSSLRKEEIAQGRQADASTRSGDHREQTTVRADVATAETRQRPAQGGAATTNHRNTKDADNGANDTAVATTTSINTTAYTTAANENLRKGENGSDGARQPGSGGGSVGGGERAAEPANPAAARNRHASSHGSNQQRMASPGDGGNSSDGGRGHGAQAGEGTESLKAKCGPSAAKLALQRQQAPQNQEEFGSSSGSNSSSDGQEQQNQQGSPDHTTANADNGSGSDNSDSSNNGKSSSKQQARGVARNTVPGGAWAKTTKSSGSADGSAAAGQGPPAVPAQVQVAAPDEPMADAPQGGAQDGAAAGGGQGGSCGAKGGDGAGGEEGQAEEGEGAAHAAASGGGGGIIEAANQEYYGHHGVHHHHHYRHHHTNGGAAVPAGASGTGAVAPSVPATTPRASGSGSGSGSSPSVAPDKQGSTANAAGALVGAGGATGSSDKLAIEGGNASTAVVAVQAPAAAAVAGDGGDAPEGDDNKPKEAVPCPRCSSLETKFCYYNNYNINQPRHYCKRCQRYWTAGGTLRNVPVGAGRRKQKNLTLMHEHMGGHVQGPPPHDDGHMDMGVTPGVRDDGWPGAHMDGSPALGGGYGTPPPGIVSLLVNQGGHMLGNGGSKQLPQRLHMHPPPQVQQQAQQQPQQPQAVPPGASMQQPPQAQPYQRPRAFSPPQQQHLQQQPPTNMVQGPPQQQQQQQFQRQRAFSPPQHEAMIAAAAAAGAGGPNGMASGGGVGSGNGMGGRDLFQGAVPQAPLMGGDGGQALPFHSQPQHQQGRAMDGLGMGINLGMGLDNLFRNCPPNANMQAQALAAAAAAVAMMAGAGGPPASMFNQVTRTLSQGNVLPQAMSSGQGGQGGSMVMGGDAHGVDPWANQRMPAGVDDGMKGMKAFRDVPSAHSVPMDMGPSNHPSSHPSNHPSSHPSNHPSSHPSNHPSNHLKRTHDQQEATDSTQQQGQRAGGGNHGGAGALLRPQVFAPGSYFGSGGGDQGAMPQRMGMGGGGATGHVSDASGNVYGSMNGGGRELQDHGPPDASGMVNGGNHNGGNHNGGTTLYGGTASAAAAAMSNALMAGGGGGANNMMVGGHRPLANLAMSPGGVMEMAAALNMASNGHGASASALMSNLLGPNMNALAAMAAASLSSFVPPKNPAPVGNSLPASYNMGGGVGGGGQQVMHGGPGMQASVPQNPLAGMPVPMSPPPWSGAVMSNAAWAASGATAGSAVPSGGMQEAAPATRGADSSPPGMFGNGGAPWGVLPGGNAWSAPYNKGFGVGGGPSAWQVPAPSNPASIWSAISESLGLWGNAGGNMGPAGGQRAKKESNMPGDMGQHLAAYSPQGGGGPGMMGATS